MVWHEEHRRSLKYAFVTNRLCTRSHASQHACRPVEHIVANVLTFINYVNEICQNQSQRHTSIIKAVQHLGIPSWLVEIRHNASHSHVPPIGTLRKAFHFCRQWLWDHFWSRQPYEAMRSAGAADKRNDVVAAEAELRDMRINNAIVAYALWRNARALISLLRHKKTDDHVALLNLHLCCVLTLSATKIIFCKVKSRQYALSVSVCLSVCLSVSVSLPLSLSPPSLSID
ncbi:hypothetical protein Y032_0057g2749 [Ancylostoma ceylanicum]|uniref:Las1-like protein n=1 Tax=Ancylostoma ceylanicum TaxID=53326 RepID=A0A016U682_9BILA|nr:hypothetical protein Y032_0057g2749 [Ancylostoma ceylanicum]